jgi:GNAT superfamily N-acetyltransferase
MKHRSRNETELFVEPGTTAADAVRVRLAASSDLDALVSIDEKLMGRRRREYFRRRLAEAMRDSDVLVSLVAESDGRVVGFLLARVHFGEFGMPETRAIVDAVGVHPDEQGKGIGSALFAQLEQNLRALRIERIQTLVDWKQQDLLVFLGKRGFEPVPRICLEVQL